MRPPATLEEPSILKLVADPSEHARHHREVADMRRLGNKSKAFEQPALEQGLLWSWCLPSLVALKLETNQAKRTIHVFLAAGFGSDTAPDGQ